MNRLIVFLLTFGVFTCISQDTLFLKNSPYKDNFNSKYLYIDSMFTITNDSVINLEYKEDSVLLDFNNEVYAKVKKFYIIIDKSTIIDSCSYYFWIKKESDYFPFFIIGYQINHSLSRIQFRFYTYKNKFFFWKRKIVGFGVSLNSGYSGLTGKVKHVGDYSIECTHEWGKNFCEFIVK
jgi:hypothetical protein